MPGTDGLICGVPETLLAESVLASLKNVLQCPRHLAFLVHQRSKRLVVGHLDVGHARKVGARRRSVIRAS